MKQLQILIFGLLIGLLMAGVILLISTYPSGEEVKILPPTTPKPPIVYITGEVNMPGVYTLTNGNRVEDLIKAAGGLTQQANISNINLAKKLVDGEKILIPDASKEEKYSQDVNGPALDLVNINTADAAELDSLPGIGPIKAEDILKYRNEHGDFKSIEDINKIPGIGPAVYSELKDFITITP